MCNTLSPWSQLTKDDDDKCIQQSFNEPEVQINYIQKHRPSGSLVSCIISRRKIVTYLSQTVTDCNRLLQTVTDLSRRFSITSDAARHFPELMPISNLDVIGNRSWSFGHVSKKFGNTGWNVWKYKKNFYPNWRRQALRHFPEPVPISNLDVMCAFGNAIPCFLCPSVSQILFDWLIQFAVLGVHLPNWLCPCSFWDQVDFYS